MKSLLRFLAEQNVPIQAIEKQGIELPMCQRCGNRPATVPTEIGDVEYDLCAPCSAKPPMWSIPA